MSNQQVFLVLHKSKWKRINPVPELPHDYVVTSRYYLDGKLPCIRVRHGAIGPVFHFTQAYFLNHFKPI